jgi:hypothetical protein
MILEAPALSSVLQRPEEALIPEVLLWTLGRDSAAYVPALRVNKSVDRRWRAKWVEATAEAMSALFLEDTILMDFTSLSRIPERRTPTPDFCACTLNNEHVVVEVKGATKRKTHARQRREALKQLGKARRGTELAGLKDPAWAGTSRSFACSLFVSEEGSDDESLLHVHDPPLALDEWFQEGWETVSRRRHYAAALQCADQFRFAEAVLTNTLRNTNLELDPKLETFEWSSQAEGEQQLVASGVTRPVAETARRLGHPSSHDFEGIRMFVGVDQRILEALRAGELPRPPRRELQGEGESGISVPMTGVLPNDRGIFSVLTDGSFLAIEHIEGE